MVQWGILGPGERQQKRFYVNFLRCARGRWVAEVIMLLLAACSSALSLEGLSIQILYYLPPKFSMCLLLSGKQPVSCCWMKWYFRSFLITSGYLNLGMWSDRSPRGFLTLNLLFSHYESSALADVSSQFSSWGQNSVLGTDPLQMWECEQCFSQGKICTAVSRDHAPANRDQAIAHISLSPSSFLKLDREPTKMLPLLCECWLTKLRSLNQWCFEWTMIKSPQKCFLCPFVCLSVLSNLRTSHRRVNWKFFRVFGAMTKWIVSGKKAVQT